MRIDTLVNAISNLLSGLRTTISRRYPWDFATPSTLNNALPTVSVVVPCYCYGQYLEQCVDSILAQEGVDVRILIIDDASPDDSFAVAQRLADRDSRIEARRHESNRGNIATFNEGLLDWASGDYSVLISADDLLVKGALARAIDVMERFPLVGLVYGHAVNWVDDRALPVPRIAPTGVRVWEGHEWIQTVCQMGHNLITSPEVVVRTDLQQLVGGYRSELSHSGDLEMWLRIAARSDIAFIEGVDQAYYRIHSRNMTVGRTLTVDLAQRAAAFKSFFADCQHIVANAQDLQRSALRQIAREALWRACRAYDRRRLGETPVAELKQLAHGIYADADRLLESWGLRWREWVGPFITPYLQIFILSAVYKRVSNALWWRRWQKKGY